MGGSNRPATLKRTSRTNFPSFSSPDTRQTVLTNFIIRLSVLPSYVFEVGVFCVCFTCQVRSIQTVVLALVSPRRLQSYIAPFVDGENRKRLPDTYGMNSYVSHVSQVLSSR